jgi:hypothetical protein
MIIVISKTWLVWLTVEDDGTHKPDGPYEVLAIDAEQDFAAGFDGATNAYLLSSGEWWTATDVHLTKYDAICWCDRKNKVPS